MLEKLDRRSKLAKRLALWSISDQVNHEAVDREVMKFSQLNKEKAKELEEIKAKIAELQEKQKEIASSMISSCRINIASLEEQTPNSVARPLVDLAFWNRVQDLNAEMYGLIQPHLSNEQ